MDEWGQGVSSHYIISKLFRSIPDTFATKKKMQSHPDAFLSPKHFVNQKIKRSVLCICRIIILNLVLLNDTENFVIKRAYKVLVLTFQVLLNFMKNPKHRRLQNWFGPSGEKPKQS